jgi:hypothetical protein
MRRSGFSGASYGDGTPVNSAISPALVVQALSLVLRRPDAPVDEGIVHLDGVAKPKVKFR